MLVYAIVAVAVAAVFSLIMAFLALRGRGAPWVVSLLTLLTGGAGTWLVYQQVMGGEDKVMMPMGILAAALVALLLLLVSKLRGVAPSKALALLHTALWIGGAALLGTMIFIHNLTY